MRLHGTINHVALTVSDLDTAMRFLGPLLAFFGFGAGRVMQHAGTRLTVCTNDDNGIAVNVWEAKHAHPFRVYEPGLHHLAFNAGSTRQVDEAHALVVELGGTVLEGPGEFPFAEGGYYAFYFLGPDDMKFEVVYMPGLDPGTGHTDGR